MELDIVKILRSCNDACETELVLKSGATLNNPIKKVKFFAIGLDSQHAEVLCKVS